MTYNILVLVFYLERDVMNSLCPDGGGREVEGEGHYKDWAHSQHAEQNTEYSCSNSHVHKITNVPGGLLSPLSPFVQNNLEINSDIKSY
jgi:hypothetical protein